MVQQFNRTFQFRLFTSTYLMITIWRPHVSCRRILCQD